MIFLDIQKAFDKIWHSGLLYKLKRIGINGDLLKLIESYLKNRSQRVVLNSSFSEFLDIVSGVPQGSILGPLLFLIYLNDIVDNISCPISLFADDTSLLELQTSWGLVENNLNLNISKLELWSRKWKLSFNAKKTVYMTFSSVGSSPNLSLMLNNSQLQRVGSNKHLGLFFDENLTWTDHVSYICKKVSKKLGLLYKNKNVFNRVTLIRLYKSMILPVIDYGSVVYDSLSLQQSNKIENLQRRAAIICSGAHPRTETNKLLSDLGWMHLKDRRIYLKRTYFYKIFVNASPPYLNADLMDLIRNPKVRDTRRSKEGKLYQPKWKKTKYRASFFLSAIVDWNGLSVDLVRVDSLNKLKKYLNEKFIIDDRVLFYNTIVGKGTKLLTQIRLGLSPLKAHLFAYNIGENPFCQCCLTHIETSIHYLFECVKFTNERVTYLEALSCHLTNANHPTPVNLWNLHDLADLCLKGSNKLDSSTNFLILNATTEFLLSSHRFD